MDNVTLDAQDGLASSEVAAPGCTGWLTNSLPGALSRAVWAISAASEPWLEPPAAAAPPLPAENRTARQEESQKTVWQT